MGYGKDLDTFSDEELVAELSRRRKLNEKSLCSYCNRSIDECTKDECLHPRYTTASALTLNDFQTMAKRTSTRGMPIRERLVRSKRMLLAKLYDKAKESGNESWIQSVEELCTEQLYRDELSCATHGLQGERGEVQDLIKKVLYHGKTLDKETMSKICEELGDNLWYIAEVCTVMGISLSDVAIANYNKLKARYPNGFSSEASNNRKKLASGT